MKKIFFLFAYILFISFPENALAHATPITYSPSSLSNLEASPHKITITFSERIEPGASSINVFGPEGRKVITASYVDPSDAHIFGSKIANPLAKGSYTVSWQVVSADDGHFTKGAYVFGINSEADESGVAETQVVHSSPSQEAFTIWLELIGEALVIGGLISYILFKRLIIALTNRTIRRFSIFMTVGCALMVLGEISYVINGSLALQSLHESGFLDAFQKFQSTTAGSFALYRLIAAIVIFSVFRFAKRHVLSAKKISASEIIILSVAILSVILRARISHAAASHFMPEFSILMNAVHLFFKDLWTGASLASAFIYLPAIFEQKKVEIFSFIALMSKIACISIAIGGASGAYVTWLHLKDFSNIETDWGGKFIILSCLALILIAARICISFQGRKLAGVRETPATTGIVKFLFSAESAILVVILFVSSFLIITTPPLDKNSGFQKIVHSQGVEMSLSETASKNTFTITLKNQNPTDLTGSTIILSNERESIGPIVMNPQSIGNALEFPKSMISISGEWTIEFIAQRKNGYDLIAPFKLNYPSDLEIPKSKSSLFNLVMIISVFGSVLFGWALYKFSILKRCSGETASL